MRADLLALTADDLAALTNRGTVKRALRELDSVSVSEAGDGTVTASADDAVVTLPPGAPLEDALCTCAAVVMCRHIVRAVLAYASRTEAPAPVEPWDPGGLALDSLRPAVLRRGRALVAAGVTATVVRSAKPMAFLHDFETTVRFLVPSDLAYARCDCADAPPCAHVVPAIEAFRHLDPTLESGVIELPPAATAVPATTAAPPVSAGSPPSVDAVSPSDSAAAVPSPGSPPSADAVSPSDSAAAVPSPGSTGSPPPADAVPPPGAATTAPPPGSTGSPPSVDAVSPSDSAAAVPPPGSTGSPPPADAVPPRPAAAPSALVEVEAALALLAEAGVAGGGTAVGDALRRAEARCRDGGLPWPADICAELADLSERHAAADAAFDPLRAAQLVGEALVRVDALRAHSVPALFAGGPRSTPETAVGGGRLIGLGTRVRQVGRLVDVDALVYDTSAHRVLALGRTFRDPDDGSVKPFASLAATSIQRAIQLAGVGAGQLVATGGRRSAGGRLRLGRRPAALAAQRFEWDTHLRAPVLVEGIAEARAIRGAPPPLAPRTAGANLVVIPLSGLDSAGFHVPTQSVVAHVRDALGTELVISSPFHHRAAGGAERLLAALDGTSAPRFVAGEVRVRGAETVIAPISLVVESGAGMRSMIQPWVDRGDPAAIGEFTAAAGDTPPGEPAVAQHLFELQSALGDLLVTGATRADRTIRDRWADLARATDDHGSVLVATTVHAVSDALGSRAHDTSWTPEATVAQALALAATLELALAL